MTIRKALLKYLLTVAVLVVLGMVIVGVMGIVVLFGAFATDSPTSTAGPGIHFATTLAGSLFAIWCAPVHVVMVLTGAINDEFMRVSGIVVEPVLAAFFWAALIRFGPSMLGRLRRARTRRDV
jgi:hypothetical protein